MIRGANHIKAIVIDQCFSDRLLDKETFLYRPVKWCLEEILKMENYFVQFEFCSPFFIILDLNTIKTSNFLLKKYRDPNYFLIRKWKK